MKRGKGVQTFLLGLSTHGLRKRVSDPSFFIEIAAKALWSNVRNVGLPVMLERKDVSRSFRVVMLRCPVSVVFDAFACDDQLG